MSRCRAPRTFLTGFRGYLHVDGYAGYEGMAHVTLAGCWAHARREFHDAIQALPKDKRQVIGRAHQGSGPTPSIGKSPKRLALLAIRGRHQG